MAFNKILTIFTLLIEVNSVSQAMDVIHSQKNNDSTDKNFIQTSFHNYQNQTKNNLKDKSNTSELLNKSVINESYIETELQKIDNYYDKSIKDKPLILDNNAQFKSNDSTLQLSISDACKQFPLINEELSYKEPIYKAPNNTYIFDKKSSNLENATKTNDILRLVNIPTDLNREAEEIEKLFNTLEEQDFEEPKKIEKKNKEYIIVNTETLTFNNKNKQDDCNKYKNNEISHIAGQSYSIESCLNEELNKKLNKKQEINNQIIDLLINKKPLTDRNKTNQQYSSSNKRFVKNIKSIKSKFLDYKKFHEYSHNKFPMQVYQKELEQTKHTNKNLDTKNKSINNKTTLNYEKLLEENTLLKQRIEYLTKKLKNQNQTSINKSIKKSKDLYNTMLSLSKINNINSQTKSNFKYNSNLFKTIKTNITMDNNKKNIYKHIPLPTNNLKLNLIKNQTQKIKKSKMRLKNTNTTIKEKKSHTITPHSNKIRKLINNTSKIHNKNSNSINISNKKKLKKLKINTNLNKLTRNKNNEFCEIIKHNKTLTNINISGIMKTTETPTIININKLPIKLNINSNKKQKDINNFYKSFQKIISMKSDHQCNFGKFNNQVG